MQWVASTLHTTSEHGVSSITTADAHTSAASSRLNWRPPADLNGLVRLTERRNLVSARVPSHFKRSLQAKSIFSRYYIWHTAIQYRNVTIIRVLVNALLQIQARYLWQQILTGMEDAAINSGWRWRGLVLECWSLLTEQPRVSVRLYPVRDPLLRQRLQARKWRLLGTKWYYCLTFGRRNYFFLILAHPVYKMWIKQESNTLELWNKLHLNRKNGEYISCLKYSVPIFVE